MDKLSDTKKLLNLLGMPKEQQSDISAYTFLSLAHLLPDSEWSLATNNWVRVHDILDFLTKHYDKPYAENSRETIRKHCLHQFRDAALIEDNGKATNSPNYMYRITSETLCLIRAYGTIEFDDLLSNFLKDHGKLIDKYSSNRKLNKVPINISDRVFLYFSGGKHNNLQKAILEEFARRFVPNCECLYVGDTEKKDMYKNDKKLNNLGFMISIHDKMPDVVLYRSDIDCIYFIEAVTSVGPMSPKRILEIQKMTQGVKANKKFITAFPDMDTYKKFISELAWETDVWISSIPDHMIHLDGEEFLNPGL